MEKRQLNLNAPLISARRYSSPLKSSELVNSQVIQAKLSSNHHPGAADTSEWDSEALIPSGIPFQWEQSPGRPKDDIVTTGKGASRLPPARALDAFRRYRSGELPRGPPGGISRFSSGERINDHKILKPQVEGFAFNDHAVLLEKLNESLNCDEGNGSESGHDAYSDALDMLSSEGPAAMDNNNLGGGGDLSSHPNLSGPFSVDTQTRDFMMKRFLQAAKAAVVEMPKYDVKTPLVVNELPKTMVKKTVSRAIAPSPKHNSITGGFPYDHHLADDGKSEDEQERRMPVKRSGRLSWWVLPRFCVKNTFRLLNPLPGLKAKKMTPSFPKAISPGTFTRNARSGPLDRSGLPAPEPPKKKFYSGLLSRDMLGNENKLNSASHYSYKPEVSQLRRYRSGNLSPYRNESPKSPFRDGAAFLGSPREVDASNANKIASSRKIFNALRNVSSKSHRDEKRSGIVVEAEEKTVYIDKSSYRKNAHVDYYSGENMTAAAAAHGFQSIEDVKARRFRYGSPDAFHDSAFPDAKRNQRHDTRLVECTKQLAVAPVEVLKPASYARNELLKSPLPPPLPNSPTESWLWKTLPSVPPEKPFPPSHQRVQCQAKHQIPKARSLWRNPAAIDPSWETIVKHSNVGQQHRPYSQEFLPRATHRQTTS